MSAAEPVATAGSLLSVGASLALVVFVIVALGLLLRRMPGAGRGVAGALRVRAALAVGPRERVLWVEAGGKHLLLGVTAQSVRTLHEFTEPPAAPPEAPAPVFADLLRRALGRGPQP